MITIQKAILHILDFQAAMLLPSDQELSLEDSTLQFLLKHTEKAYMDQGAKNGVFYEDSVFQEQLKKYRQQEVSFTELSRFVVETIFSALSHAEEMQSADVIVSQTLIEDIPWLVIFKCNNHQGFIHQVVQLDSGLKNDIIPHCAIMPSPSQKINEFAFINLEDLSIKFSGPRYTIDGNQIYVFPELLLECSHSVSPKEMLKAVSKTAQKVAEEYGQNDVAAVTAVKSYISENIQESGALDPQEIGKSVFEGHPGMQSAYEEQILAAGIAAPVAIDRESTLKKMKNHKLKTDTGIELSIPLDYFHNTEYVEFTNNPDGTLSITLKHILNLSNRI